MSDSRAFSQFEPPFESVQPSTSGVGQVQPGPAHPYAVIRRYSGLDPRNAGEVTRQVNEGLLPVISRIPGFLSYCALHTGGDVIASISIFEDRAGAEESSKQAAAWVSQHLASLVPSPAQHTAGRVIAYKVNEGELTRSRV